MTAMLSAFSTSMSRSADPLWKNKSLKLAQAYLDEILSKKYDNDTPLGGVPATTSISCGSLGPESGEIRAEFDDVDDYNSLSDNPPKLVTNNDMTGYAGYTVQVTVICAGDDVSVSNDNAKLITVTVTSPNNTTMPFSAYRGNF